MYAILEMVKHMHNIITVFLLQQCNHMAGYSTASQSETQLTDVSREL